ncbi:MAG: Alkaline phosphatase [Verrucomicrobiales bacterium]|nr:Alkaline phosphatase [Verrucomicrobiales bacterium]
MKPLLCIFQGRTSIRAAAKPFLLLLFVATTVSSYGAASNSVARVWDERALGAVRVDRAHPPVQARNLFSLSVAMYDAWAAYDPTAVGFIYRGKHTAPDIAAARSNAISYAAFRILTERHAYSINAFNTLVADTNLLVSLGYSPANTTRDTNTPTGVGNSVYDVVSAWFINDGARQLNAYADYPANQGGYVYSNVQLATDRPGIDDGYGHTVSDINHWQRLQIVNAVDNLGNPVGALQTYLGAQWLGVRPVALTRTDITKPWIDPGPPPFFGTATHANFVSNVVEVLRYGSQLSPDDGVLMDTSPGSFGNNSVGKNDGTGHPLNPATGLPYAQNQVKRGDFVRFLAEFWADGPNSETPPGHWNVLANAVADHPAFTKRIGGTGPVLGDLEWDVKMYLAVNAAVHEAACAAWSIKRYYDAWRPMSAIRYLAGLGQSTAPAADSYNANGLPLITNLIELVTPSSVASGRHAGLFPGKIAIMAWPGQPDDPTTQHSGVTWIHAETWRPYQKTNFVTPPFPGYISGHSTFSRSAAEVLAAMTGTPFFPGGMAVYNVQAGHGIDTEYGPSQSFQVQWATFYDAADQAGLSRIWGGIHPPIDDFTGRQVGSQCGIGVWNLVSKYFDGSIVTNLPPTLAMNTLNPATCEVRFNTQRGFYYKLQSTTNFAVPFADEGGASIAYDSSMARTNATAGPQKYYRAVKVLTP